MEQTSDPVPLQTPDEHDAAVGRPAVEALVAGVVTLGVFVLGSVLLVGSGSAEALGAVAAAALLSWRTVLFAGGLAIVGLRMGGASPERRRMAFIVVAVLATLIDVIIGTLPGLLAGGAPVVLTAVAWLLQLFAFGASAVIGALAAGLVVRGASRPRAAAVATALLMLGGTAAALLLFLQYLEVYFTIWGEADPASAEQEARYLVTAGAALGLVLAGGVLAAVRRRKGAVLGSILLLVFTLVIAGVFAVPRDRWTPEPAPVENDDYAPCFGEGPNCVGG